jgi:hypothetical protein
VVLTDLSFKLHYLLNRKAEAWIEQGLLGNTNSAIP